MLYFLPINCPPPTSAKDLLKLCRILVLKCQFFSQIHIPRSTAHNLLLCPFVPYFGRTPLSDVLIPLVIYDNHTAFQPVIEVFLSETFLISQNFLVLISVSQHPIAILWKLCSLKSLRIFLNKKIVYFVYYILFVFSKINSSVCSAWCPSFILWIFHKYLVSLG